MDTDVLAQLIDTKHQLLVQLQQLAARQPELIESGDMTRIMTLLAIKQRLLNAVDQTEKRLDPFREQDPEQRVWQSPAHRERAREVSASCDALLQEIMALERNSGAQLSMKRDRAEQQIQGLHVSAQVAKAYLPADDSSGGQFDASCES